MIAPNNINAYQFNLNKDGMTEVVPLEKTEDGFIVPTFNQAVMELSQETIRLETESEDAGRERFKIPYRNIFSDQKSRASDIHKSRLSDPVRLRRLMIGVCLAYIWIVFLGTLAIRDGWTKIIRRSDRCDLSLFQAGLKLPDYFLDHDIKIPVGFHIPNLTT